MNPAEWIQLIAMVTAQILSAVHPETHTPALVTKAVATAQTVVNQIAANVPAVLPGNAPAPVPVAPAPVPVEPAPAPAPVAAPEIDYDKLAAAIKKANEPPQE